MNILHKRLIFILVIISVVILSFFGVRRDFNTQIWLLYFSKIKSVEEFYCQTGKVPAEIKTDTPFIIYAPEAIIRDGNKIVIKAYIWFKVSSGMHIGYIVPDSTYVLADGEFDGVSEEYELKIIRVIENNAPSEFKKHFYAHYTGVNLD